MGTVSDAEVAPTSISVGIRWGGAHFMFNKALTHLNKTQ